MSENKKTAYELYQEADLNFAGMRGSNITYRTDNSKHLAHANRANASRDAWQNIETDTSVRDLFTRQDYEYFRPNESVAKKPKEIINQCTNAYREVGLLRNVVDLMADFGSQGITLSHPVPNIQKFYRDWFSQVVGPERSERFLNLLYRAGNVVIRRTNAKVTSKITKDMRGYASTDDVIIPEKKSHLKKNIIPWKYTFLSTNSIEAIGGELSQFVGSNQYALKISSSLYSTIKYPQTAAEKALIAKLPDYIKKAILNDEKLIPLDNDNIIVKFYKKDDWQVWADPMLYAIMDDIIMLEKLKLADRAALDGIISQIRIWKLGSLIPDHEMFPNEAAINKLLNILSSNPGGGPFDIVWGPELEFDETSTEAYKFLGPQKYEPTLNDIHAGLGVPSTLTGAGASSGFTNNFISLKTLVKRLEYGRSVLTGWWNEEIHQVQKAMGFKVPATVRYDRMILTDEAAEKALILDLWDRHLMTDSTILERFGEDPELENRINKRETKERDSAKRPQKAGPYHTAEKDHELKKLSVGRGYLKASQVGVDVEETYEKEPFLEVLAQKPTGAAPQKNSDSTGTPGRPYNSKDSKPRNRTVTPRTAADTNPPNSFDKILWAKNVQEKISHILNPHLLSFFNKNNLRELSAKEVDYCEDIKFAVLANIGPYTNITDDIVLDIAKMSPSIPVKFVNVYNENVGGKKISLKERHLCQAFVYSELS